jgi:hypothetical protein
MSYRRYPSAGSNPSVSLNGQPIPSSATLVAGSDGTDLQPIKVDASGELQVDVISSALPTGAATEATLASVLVDTGNIATDVASIDASSTASAASLASIDSKLANPMPIEGGNATAVKVDGSAVTQPISAASLPLPTGAATEATLGNIYTEVGYISNGVIAIDAATTASAASLASIDGKLANPMPISASSLPLPSGAATSSNQTSGAQKTQITNSAGTAVDIHTLGTTLVSGDEALVVSAVIHGLTTGGGGGFVDVKVNPSGALAADVSGSSVSVSNFPATQPISGSVSVSNFPATQPISAASLPLPTGAATETTLAAVSGKLPATLGQTTMSASLPVTLASDQSAILTKDSYSRGEFVRNNYSSSSVITSLYTQLVASTAAAYSAIEIFDSSGETLKLAIGAAGAEVDQFLIFPGGNGRIPYSISAGSRISIMAVSNTANNGEICLNLYV